MRNQPQWSTISRVGHFNGNLRHHHRRHRSLLHTHKLLSVSHYEMELNMQPGESSSSSFHSQSFSVYVLFIIRRNFSYIQQYRFMRFKNVRAWNAKAGKKSLGAIQFINCEWKLFFCSPFVSSPWRRMPARLFEAWLCSESMKDVKPSREEWIRKNQREQVKWINIILINFET